MQAKDKKPDQYGISIREIFEALRDDSWWLVGITSLFCIIAMLYSLFATEIYRAETILAPSGVRQNNSPFASQLGGAAALIGISVPVAQDGTSRVQNAIATIKSRQFISRFIQKNNLKVSLFASSWDKNTRESTIDGNKYDLSTETWLIDSNSVSDEVAFKAINSILHIVEDTTTGLVRIYIDWRDPALASVWVNEIVRTINKETKEADLNEARRSIDYLQDQLMSTSLVEMQAVLYELIKSQFQVVMLADVREEYVFQVIDPAVATFEPIGQPSFVIISFGALCGLFLSILFVYIKRNLTIK